MDEELREGTTPRPWTVMEERVVSTFDPLPGHRFRTVADCRYRNGEADAALIVEAVNDYDRLRRIEAAAREWRDADAAVDWTDMPIDEETAAEVRLDEAEAALRAALGEDQ